MDINRRRALFALSAIGVVLAGCTGAPAAAPANPEPAQTKSEPVKEVAAAPTDAPKPTEPPPPTATKAPEPTAVPPTAAPTEPPPPTVAPTEPPPPTVAPTEPPPPTVAPTEPPPTEAPAAAKAQAIPVFIDFYADW